MKKIIFMFLALFSFPLISNAASYCNDTLSLSYNVNIAYTYNISDNNVSYTILITNLSSDMLVVDKQTSKVYKNFSSKNQDLNIKTTKNGTYSFEIYSMKCKESVRTMSVSLPKYNKYFDDERCKDYKNYSICRRWRNSELSEKEFTSELKKIKDNEKVKVNNEEEKEKNTNTNWYDNLTGLLLKYWWALIIIILSIIGIVYIIRTKTKKEEFNFKL